MLLRPKPTRKPPAKISDPDEKIDLIQRIRQTFTPGTPVQDPAMFAARLDEVLRLHNFVQTPGQVAFIFGERGVGKTSLAKHTAATFSKEFRFKNPLFKSCDPEDDFATLFAQPLKEGGVDVLVDAEWTGQQDSRFLNVKLGPIGGKLGADRNDGQLRRGAAAQADNPSWVADRLAGLRRIFVIDELDILDAPETKRKLGLFIKHLSDRSSVFKIILTGIAESMQELLTGHASNLRCLKEVRLPRMSEADVAAIIHMGEKKLGIQFNPEATAAIVEISEGYPASAHLVAGDAAAFAAEAGNRLVTVADVKSAIVKAFTDFDEQLRKKYERSLKSERAEEYRKVLMAIAHCRADQIKSRDILESYKERVKGAATEAQVRAFVNNLAADDTSRVLQRTAPGVYRFTDARLPGLIRLAESYERAKQLNVRAV
jgi:hypothetical protein